MGGRAATGAALGAGALSAAPPPAGLSRRSQLRASADSVGVCPSVCHPTDHKLTNLLTLQSTLFGGVSLGRENNHCE